jgi:hypothetical protein
MLNDSNGNVVFETSDMAIAAFLMLKSLVLLSVSKPTKGPYRFTFSDPNGLAQKYVIEFASSDICKFDAHMKYLRRLQ